MDAKDKTRLILSRYYLFTAAFLIFLTFPVNVYGLSSFPGAEGFGSNTPGGRGGKVISVTNLNEKGPGSFRAACNSTGPRIIVFKTGGTITLTSKITINNPYITIAGQTAPGDGICLKGASLVIQTHDVIVRGLRIRVGDNPQGPNPDSRDGLSIQNNSTPPYNIIIDHCSLSWAIDENLDFWYPCHDITIQYCILSEALHDSLHSKGSHSTAILVGEHAKKISIHHCLMAHCNGRNPLMKFDTETEVINNVVYNWGTWGCTRLGNYEDQNFTVSANIIGNVYKPLEYTSPPISIDIKTRAGSKIYVKDNIGPRRLTNNGDDWLIVGGSSQHRVDTFAFPPSGINIQPVNDVLETVLNNSGAVVPHRDTVDARAVQTTLINSGRIINSQDEVGGWPNYLSGMPPTDLDFDGMPDVWEVSHGLDPRDSTDGNSTDISSEGYSNVEVFINGLFTDSREVNTDDGRDVDNNETLVLKPSLHRAAISGYEDMAESLLADGANVNARDDYGATPLHYATNKGHKEIADLFIASSADVNATDNVGDTPLHLAVKSGERKIVELLIDNGADLNVSNNNGVTPLHCVATQPRPSIPMWRTLILGEDPVRDMAELLISKGADVNATDSEGKTPLERAEENRHSGLAALLREHGDKH